MSVVLSVSDAGDSGPYEEEFSELGWDNGELSDCCYMMINKAQENVNLGCALLIDPDDKPGSDFDLEGFLAKYNLDFLCFVVKPPSSISILFLSHLNSDICSVI